MRAAALAVVLALTGCASPVESTSPNEIPKVPRGKTGSPADAVVLHSLQMAPGVNLLHGSASLRDSYPYLLGDDGAERVALTQTTTERIFAPVTTEAAAVELVRLFHAGLIVEDEGRFRAVLGTAREHGFAPATTTESPGGFGLRSTEPERGVIRVDLTLYENSTQRLGVRTHAYTFTGGRLTEHSTTSWLEGPAQHWQTGFAPTPGAREQAEAANAERTETLRMFDEAAREAVISGALEPS